MGFKSTQDRTIVRSIMQSNSRSGFNLHTKMLIVQLKRRQKEQYDSSIRESTVGIGDRVLSRKVALKDKIK